MYLDSLSSALFQITNAVSNLSKRTFKSYTSEISNLVSEYGPEAERHFIRCLFSSIDFSGDGRTTGKDSCQIQLLSQEFSSSICKPNFISVVCFSIDNPFHNQKSLKPTSHLLQQISRVLKLTTVQDVALGLALQHSNSQELKKFSTQFLKQKLLQLVNVLIETDSRNTVSIEGNIRDTPIELLYLICSNLQIESFREAISISVDQKELFFQALKKGYPQDLVPVVLAPFLSAPTFDFPIDCSTVNFEFTPAIMTTSLVDTIHEVGYNFTKSKDQCKNVLIQFGIKSITPAQVARALGLMARVPVGFVDPLTGQNPFVGSNSNWSDGGKDVQSNKQEAGSLMSWNVEVFITAIKELVPNLAWKDTIKELDHQYFYISNKLGFENLVKGLSLCIDNFPIGFVYNPWKNKEGQMSWISSALKYPEVFCFANFSSCPVDVSCLKNPPDEKNRDIVTWKSMDLINILLQLSDEGFQTQVLDLFKFPMTQCPDLLLIGILQSPCWNGLKQEMICSLLPVFLGQHNNALSVMNFTWHVQGGQSPTVRTMVLRSMADWYMRDLSDSTRLARVLDMAQDLKALSTLLGMSPFPFVIDLACLAARREYLKLDKWMNDKIRDHGETFVEECVNFIMTKASQQLGFTKEDSQSISTKSAPIPHIESHHLNIMLTCLQNYVATNRNASTSLQEAVLKMVQSFKQKQQQQQQQQPGQIPNRVAAAGPSLTTVSIPNSQQADHGPNLNALGFSAFALNPANNPAMNPHPQFPRPGAPGSPAKGFNVIGAGAGQMGQQPLSNQQLYNSSAISSQLQGLNLHSSISNGYGAGPMIGSQLGAAAAAAHGLNGTGLNNNPNLNSSLSSSLLGGQAGFSGIHANLGAPTLSTLSTAALGHQRQQQGMAGLAGMDSSGAMSNQQYSKEVEDEANSYFKRIFNNSASNTTCVAPMTVNELLELMKRFKNSTNPRETEVYSCMMRNLYEEYKFFSQYPERELLTTANLFGGLIEYGLVSFVTLGFALRCTLEALKKPGGKMYTFGLTALDKFKTKLKEYPQYCQYLSMLPTFNDFPQTLKEYITYGAQSMDAPHSVLPAVSSVSSPTTATTTLAIVSSQASIHSIIAATTAAATHGAISRPANSSYRSSIANATNIDTLLANKEGMDNVVVPNEALQDKVFFIFNNLSQANMDQKAKEMNDQVGDEFMAWVAQYLVMKRASTEHNFHTLYTNFIEHLHKTAFLEMVIAETYRNIKVLLRSDKGVANFSDRTLLKNLGHWLGMIMLAKNKPILQVDLDLKAMVYEAFVKGPDELLYVVPFVAKVLESAIKSRVFRPPNPWTMAIMNVLSELHREPELKLNLKFEIEVLCKNLQIDINELEPGNYLKDQSRMSSIVPQLSPNKHRKVDTTPLPEENTDMGMSIQGPPTTPAQQHQQVTSHGGSVVEVPPMQQQYGGTGGYPQQEMNTVAGATAVATPTPPATGNLSHHLIISDQINLFHIHPHLKQYVKPSIERAIQEMLPPAVEKAVSIAIKSADIIIKKDFSLEPDENKMRMAAHQFVRFMTAGMALITCHEPIMVSIINNLKTVFSSALRMPTPQQKEMIDAAANIIAQDNAELATVFVQKTAVEKAIPDIDKRLQGEYEARRTAKQGGRHYYDENAFLAQERLPEKIRLRLGGVSQAQMAVYEEFTRNIPGFVPTINEHSLQVVHSQLKNMQSYGAEDVLQMYDKVSRDLEQSLGMLNGSPLQALLQQLLDQVLQTRNSARDVNSAIILLQRAVEGLMEGLLMTAIPGAHETVDQTTRFRDCHLLVLKFLQDVRVYGHQWTNKQVTRCLVECREELRYSIDAVCALLQSQLVVISHYDSFLASLVDGNSYNAIPFAMQIVQRFCIESEKHHEMRIHEGDFANTIESLQKAVLHSRGPETLPGLLDSVRQHSTESGLIDRSVMTAPTMMHSGITQAHEFNDPPGFQEKADYLIREWVNTFHSTSSLRDNNKSFNQFINHMWFQGILKTDELITRFFRVSTESCVGMCYRLLNDPAQNPTRVRFQCFNTLDAFVKLIVLLLKNSGDPNNNITKVNLLNKVLGVVTGVLVQDHEMKKTEFYPLPYHRIFIMLFIELNAPDQILEPLNLDVLTAFSNVLHILRPAKVASFTFAWLEIISHRVFVGKMLALNRNQKTWGMYAQLIVDLFNFMAPYLRNADLPKPVHQLYKGTMKVFLVLLHDFPELFVEYHYALCDAIPTNCIQIRNLVLSAYPKNMRLPDPFTPNLRVDMMPDINSAPRIATNYVANIQPLSFKRDLDSYLNSRKPVTFLSDLRSRLQVSNTPGVKYNVPLLNSLVLHVGSQAINHIYTKGLAPSVSTIAHSSHMDIFQNLAVDLDTEGRYLFLNAMANHLRFPNSHTQYFSSTLLYLFAEANTEAIQEQITRVLLERLMVNRPHPWGLLLTFIELLKNPSYKFWNHEFVRCAPEIERLLDSVARSCSHGKTMTRDVDSGDVR